MRIGKNAPAYSVANLKILQILDQSIMEENPFFTLRVNLVARNLKLVKAQPPLVTFGSDFLIEEEAKKSPVLTGIRTLDLQHCRVRAQQLYTTTTAKKL